MDRQELLRRLLSTFLDELEDHVASWNRDLLALEDGPQEADRDELLHSLFRTAHSVKGAARVVKIDTLEHACHSLETLLSKVRSDEIELTPQRIELLFVSGDALEDASVRLRAGRSLDDSRIAELVPTMKAAASGEAFELTAHRAPVAAPPSPPPPEPTPAPKAVDEAQRPPRTSTTAEAAVAAPPAEVSAGPGPPAAQVPEAPGGTRVGDAAGMGTIRVASEKLDALMAQSGELLVSSRRLHQLGETAQQLADIVNTWRKTRGDGHLAPRELRGDRATAALQGRSDRTSRGIRTGDRFSSDDAEILTQLSKGLDRLIASIARDGRQIAQSARSLDERVQGLRMTPFAGACRGLERTVRDLAKNEGKQVELRVVGGDVELDRAVVTQLVDPLRHLIRNAVNHGIELGDERIAAGKDSVGLITVSADLRGAQVEISVADDGQGLNLESIRQKARQRHLIVPHDENELVRLIFQPGFSTAPMITDISGRGVGLDVVRTRVESLHGTVSISSVPGQGTEFHMLVPLTISTIRALLIEAWGQRFAVPSTNVDQLRRLMPDDVLSIEGKEMLMVDERPIPLASLGETLGLARPDKAERLPPIPAVVLTGGTHRMAFLVDELIGEQEVVIKGLGARLRRVRNIGGATILPTGEVLLILNAAELIRNAYLTSMSEAFSEAIVPDSDVKKRILVVDDSITTRTLEQSILEAAGFDVISASDGAQAWEIIQNVGADLVVADVEMPRMDGFALTESIRSARRLQHVPVVLVTTLDSDAHKARGVEVGANAYLVKSGFDQRTLLATIRQLL